MTTMYQKEEGDSMMEDDDLYAVELQRIKEAPTKRLKEKNEKLRKQFHDLQNKKKLESNEVDHLQSSIDGIEEELRNTRDAFEAHQKKEASPLKKKYENRYQSYIDRVSDLEKMKDNIAKDTLDALSGLVDTKYHTETGSDRRKAELEDDDPEAINTVGHGHKNRKKYRPAVDAK